eukprot:4928743-Pyramimonas_sp.AAC.1
MRQCKLAYIHSRMYRLEELVAKELAVQMTFLEFVEATARVADLISFPTEEEVRHLSMITIVVVVSLNLNNVTSFYGSSCANNGKDALNTPDVM